RGARFARTKVFLPSPGSPWTMVSFPRGIYGYQSHFTSSALISPMEMSFRSGFISSHPFLCVRESDHSLPAVFMIKSEKENLHGKGTSRFFEKVDATEGR